MNGGAYGARDQGRAGRGARRRPQRQRPRASATPTWALHLPPLRRARGRHLHRRRCSRARRAIRAAIAAEMDKITEAREATPADQEPHRRLDLQESAGPQGLAADRRRRLPRPRGRRRAGLGDALQFPDQSRQATAADIETLGETVRERVKANSGVELEWEIKRIGVERMSEPILIVGGGIGAWRACSTALALAKGLPVRVIEGAPEFGAIGYGIQLGPNVFPMFDRLGVTEAVLAKCDFADACPDARCVDTGDESPASRPATRFVPASRIPTS